MSEEKKVVVPAPVVASAPAAGVVKEGPTTATDKAVRPGGAYIVRGRWVDAHGAVISEEEQAEYKLAPQSAPEVPLVQPGAGVTEPDTSL